MPGYDGPYWSIIPPFPYYGQCRCGGMAQNSATWTMTSVTSTDTQHPMTDEESIV